MNNFIFVFYFFLANEFIRTQTQNVGYNKKKRKDKEKKTNEQKRKIIRTVATNYSSNRIYKIYIPSKQQQYKQFVFLYFILDDATFAIAHYGFSNINCSTNKCYDGSNNSIYKKNKEIDFFLINLILKKKEILTMVI
jgi:hypothetical protein